MAFLYQPDGHSEASQEPRLSVRVSGFVLAFVAFLFLIAQADSWLRVDPFEGQVLKRTKAVILSLKPGTSRHYLRSYTGYYFHYQFVLGQDAYDGEFFALSNRYYQVGHEVDVEYRSDDPAINRWAQSSSGAGGMAVMNYVVALVFAGVFVVGVVMCCTGKNILNRRRQMHRWWES